MQKVGGVVQSKGGRVVVGAIVRVFLAGTVTPATIYSDPLGQNAIELDKLKSDNEGEYGFYVANGRYDVKTYVQGRLDGQYLDVLAFDPGDLILGDNSLVPTPSYDDVPRLSEYPQLNAQAQAIANRFAYLESANGSIRLGFSQAGTGAVARSVEDELRGRVSVSQFLLFGEADQTQALARAAAYANFSGIPLVVNPGVYYVNTPGAPIELKVSLFAHGATFKFGPNRGGNAIFRVIGDNALTDITSSVNLSEFLKYKTHIPSLAPYVNGFVKILSNIPNVKRLVTDATPLLKSEANYVTKGGCLLKPIRHSYSTGGAITSVQFMKDDDEPLIIEGGCIDVNGCNKAGFVLINRSNVHVRNWTPIDSTKSAQVDNVLLFRPINCANVTFSDFYGDSMNQSVTGEATFSYLFNCLYAVNLRFQRIHTSGGWGAFDCENVNGYHITDSVIDRFDCHYDSYDISVNGCELDQVVQVGSGGGYFRVTNSTKYVKKATPYLANETHFTVIARCRSDYSGYFDGDITLDNINVVVDADYDPASKPLVGVSFSAAGDFGSSVPLPFGRVITVRNITIDAPDAILANANTVFYGVRLTGAGLVIGAAPGTIPPTAVTVENIKYRAANTAARIVGYLNEVTASSLVVGAVTRQNIAGDCSGGVRGLYSVDWQQMRSFDSRIASGASAVIAGGTENSATGEGAAVGGGSQNVASGPYSFIPGGMFGTTRGRFGSWAWSAKSDTVGRYQSAGGNYQFQSSNGTPQRLVADSQVGAATATNQFGVPVATAINFDAFVTARRGSNGLTKAWRLTGLIKNEAGTTVLVGAVTKTVIAADVGTEAWDVSATADDTLDCLALTVTGQSGVTIRWHARVEASEVS